MSILTPSATDLSSIDYQTSWEEFQKSERVKELPLRVRVNLRDNYYAPSSLVAEAVSSLSKELGKPVETNVDWARVWTELASDSLEASDLVPGMSNVIVALTQAVENCCTADEEWGDMLLTRLGTAGKERLDLWILVDPTIMTYEPSWISHNASIALRIPQQSAASMKAVSAMTILPSLRDIFTKAALEEPSSSKDSEWADLGVADDVKVPEQAGIGFRQGPAAMPLPNVNSLPAPESLTNKALPYMCTIFDQRGDLEVTCSHEGTLNVLATYLEVHARPNIHRTDKKPYMECTRQESHFGSGMSNGSFVISEAGNWGLKPNPMLVLALLQGSLGYELLHTDGRNWVLKRDAAFAS